MIMKNYLKSFSLSLPALLSAAMLIAGCAGTAEPKMVFVEGGTFTMGCTAEQGGECEDRERPLHSVTLSSFYIGKYEVTQAQWKAVMGSSLNYHEGDNLPVDYASWDDAQKFIEQLNVTTGKKYRLPTEAEWEYAARGGNKSKGYKYSGSNNIDDVAWYGVDSGYDTHPAGTKKPNELGIYDMSGNVWEWCSDNYGKYSASEQTNPVGSGYNVVIRGGSWNNNMNACRAAYRAADFPSQRGDKGIIGFRLACDAE
jgi:formylglycine-generating enzyme required for sulfatase activity